MGISKNEELKIRTEGLNGLEQNEVGTVGGSATDLGED